MEGDGDTDLLFHFKTEELNLKENSAEATLTGDTTDKKDIKGTDEANIVPRTSNTASPALPTRAAPHNPHYYTTDGIRRRGSRPPLRPPITG